MLSQKRTTIAIATSTRMTCYYDNTTTTTAKATTTVQHVRLFVLVFLLLLLLLQLSFQTVEATTITTKTTITVKDAINDVRDIIFDHHSSEKNIKVCFQDECPIGISVNECISNIRQSLNTNNKDDLILRFHIVSDDDNDEELLINNNNSNNDKQQVSASSLSSSSFVSLSYNNQNLRYYELPIPTNLLGEVSCLSSRDEKSGTTVPIGQMIGFMKESSVWTVDDIHSFNMKQHLPTVNCLGISFESCCLLYKNTLSEKHIPLEDIHGKQITCYPYVVSTTIPFMPIRHSSEEESSSSFGYVDYIWKSNNNVKEDTTATTSTESRKNIISGDNNDVANKENEENEEVSQEDSSSLLGGTCIPIELTINDDIIHLEEHLQTSIQTILNNIQSLLNLSNHNTILMKEQEVSDDDGGGDRIRYLRSTNHLYHSTKQQQQQKQRQQHERQQQQQQQQQQRHHYEEQAIHVERTLLNEEKKEDEDHIDIDVQYITCHDLLSIQEQIIDIGRLFSSDEQTTLMNLNSILLLKKQNKLNYYCIESHSDLVEAKQIYNINGHVMDWSYTHGFEILPTSVYDKLVQLQKLVLLRQQEQQNEVGEDIIYSQYLQPTIIVIPSSDKNIVTSIPYRISTNNLNTLKQISCF